MKTLHLLLLSILPAMPLLAEAPSPADEMQRAVLVEKDLKRIESLLQSGFDPKTPIGCGDYDALDGAVNIADPQMVELLLQHGAKPKKSTLANAAFIASHNEATRIVAMLLKAGADVNSEDRSSALHWAVWRQNSALVSLLLAQKNISLNDLNIDDRTPLMIAVEKGDKPLVEMLLKAGADPAISNSRKMTSADCSQAVIQNQQAIQSLLLDKLR